MRERANVIPFLRRFKRKERDFGLADYIIGNEMSGVLNGALAGLRRLRSRGNFEVPQSCVDYVDKWTGQANQSQLFMRAAYAPEPGHREKFSHVWGNYKKWCEREGTKNMYSRTSFREAIEDLGYYIETVQKVYRVKDIRQEVDFTERTFDE